MTVVTGEEKQKAFYSFDLMEALRNSDLLEKVKVGIKATTIRVDLI